MGQVSVVARIEAKPGKGDELAAAAADMVAAVEAEAGTLVYALSRSPKEPEVFWFFELYTGKEALAEHGQSDAMKAFQARIADIIAPGTQIHRLTPVVAKGVEFAPGD